MDEMKILFEPMFAAFLSPGGGPFVILVVTVTLFCVFVVPIAGVVAIVYFLAQRAKTKPQPASVAPLSPPATPFVSKTIVSHQCPQCGARLPVDAPEGLCPACLLQRGFATEAGAPAGQSSFVPPSVAELAKLFPQLEILECLGRGGMGAVYKARQPRLERFVALKILAPEKQSDPQFAERFEREARALARLNHPNIVAVFDSGEVQGKFYLIMEFVDGLTLRQVIQNGKLSPAEALQIVPKICEALQYAHEQGIVHRDIKPENILLDKQGRVKIADFGIAKIAGKESTDFSLTGARDVMGTPHYMAPEQVEKPQSVDHRADIYSLGVVFYEMLTGELPLGKFALPSKKVQVDVRLDEVVLHALEKEPARRYQQASQVKTDVETIAGTPAQFGAQAAAVSLIPNTGIITAPAVALMVAGLWKILSACCGLLFFYGGKDWLGNVPGIGDNPDFKNILGAWSSVAIVSIALFKIIPGLLIVFGGYQMLHRRSYAWAIGAGIISIVSCSLIGFPVGIWALIVLARDDVKVAFGPNANAPSATPAAPQPNRFWRNFAMVTGCVIGIPLVLIIVVILMLGVTASSMSSPADAKELTPQELQQAGIRQEGGEFRKDSTQSFPLNADGVFNLDNVKGRIEIDGWNSNVVTVTTAIHGKTGESVAAIKIKIDSDPARIAVHTEEPKGQNGLPLIWAWLRGHGDFGASVDYVVHAPFHAQLTNIKSVNGHIEIEDMTGNINASTVNGSMAAKNAASGLKLSTVNGSIDASMSSLGDGQTVSLNSVNGEITLSAPDNANATFSAGTVNGGISSEFPALTVKRSPGNNSLKGNLGQGSASVKANTVNGAITIQKIPEAEAKP
jgi:predicted Ser/Thr protein kinase